MSEWVDATVYKDSISDEALKTSNHTNSQSQSNSSSIWEIEEDCFEISTIDGHTNSNGVIPLDSIKEELDGKVAFDRDDDDVVYVGVGKSNSSMDALVWLLNDININSSETAIFLVHIFPEIRFIPTPLGKLPISQVNQQQKETYINQERIKRRDFLQKFLNACSASKIKVDTILIESDLEAKALLDLIPILNIKKLVLGTTKSSLRKLRSRKGNGIVDQVLQNAPQFCDIKIICEGAVVDDLTESLPPSPSPSPSRSPRETVATRTQTLYKEQNDNLFGCTCFKSKAIG